jgi:hypothetical protein
MMPFAVLARSEAQIARPAAAMNQAMPTIANKSFSALLAQSINLTTPG